MRRQRRWIAVVAFAAAIVVVALLQLGGGGNVPSVDPTTTAPTVGRVTVDPNNLVGLPSANASDLLTEAGFLVALNPVDAPGIPPGVVTGVEPSGQVPSGATVTLNISRSNVSSTTTSVTDEHGNGKGKGKDKGKD